MAFPHVFSLKMTQRSLTYYTICWHIHYFQYYSIYIRTSYYFQTDISFLPEFDLSSFSQVKHSLCQASFLFLMEIWITRSLLQYRLCTAWKVSVFGVILVRMRGMRTRITPDMDTFRAVMIMLQFIRKNPKKKPLFWSNLRSMNFLLHEIIWVFLKHFLNVLLPLRFF